MHKGFHFHCCRKTVPWDHLCFVGAFEILILLLFFIRPFFVGDPSNGGHCVPCLEFCNGHSQFCYHIDHFNGTPTSQLYAEDSRWPQFTLAKQLETERGPLAAEAVCVNCGQMTIGKKCDHCKLGYFGGAANGQSDCKACNCNGHGDTCDEVNLESNFLF